MSTTNKEIEILCKAHEEIYRNSYLLEQMNIKLEDETLERDKESKIVYINKGGESNTLDYTQFRKFIIDKITSIEVSLDNIDLENNYKEKVIKGNMTDSEYIKYAGSVYLARIKYEQISKKL